MVDLVLNKLNELRTDPKQFKKEVSTLSKAMRRIKKKQMADELDKYLIELDTSEPVNPVQLSPALCELCEVELDRYIKEQREPGHKPYEDLKREAEKYVKGFKKLYMAYENGGCDMLIGRMVCSEYDPGKLNKKNFMDVDYNFVGIAYKIFTNEDEVVVIMMADFIDEEDHFHFDDYSDLKVAFDSFDVHKTGKLDPHEVKNNLKALNYDLENPIVYAIIDSLDTEANRLDGVNFKQFCLAFDRELYDSKTESGIRKLFNFFIDDPHQSTLNERSIKKLCDQVGIPLKKGEAKEIIERASRDGREITFDEFYMIMISHSKDDDSEN